MTDDEAKAEAEATEAQVLEALKRLKELRCQAAEGTPGKPGLENPWPAVLKKLRAKWKREHPKRRRGTSPAPRA